MSRISDGYKIIFAVILVVLFFYPSECLSDREPIEIICQKDTLYQYVAVVEDASGKERYLLARNRGFKQGGIFINAPDKLLLDYTKTAFVGLAFLQRVPQRVLFIGLGVGAMPRYFNHYFPDSRTDIVEIDPGILDIAEKYFHFRENKNMRVNIEDGRIFVKRTSMKYDMIVLDAYQNSDIPFHLTTLDFLKEVRARLKKDGVLVSNISIPPWTRLFDCLLRTYSEAFAQLFVFMVKEGGNFIFIATTNKHGSDLDHLMERAVEIDSSKGWDLHLSHIVPGQVNWTKGRERKGELLTDDFAPVNIYRHQVPKREK